MLTISCGNHGLPWGSRGVNSSFSTWLRPQEQSSPLLWGDFGEGERGVLSWKPGSNFFEWLVPFNTQQKNYWCQSEPPIPLPKEASVPILEKDPETYGDCRS